MGASFAKGAVSAVAQHAREAFGMPEPPDLETVADGVAAQGATPLAVSVGGQILGVIALSDVLRHNIRQRVAQLRAIGIRTVMVTGDNPVTAMALAAQAGVDDFVAEAKPEEKLRLIRFEQSQGRLVAMTGDGTNDAPALAQADVGLAMHITGRSLGLFGEPRVNVLILNLALQRKHPQPHADARGPARAMRAHDSRRTEIISP
jgi:potassium-transporting ATPase ATP-binding subunit